LGASNREYGERGSGSFLLFLVAMGILVLLAATLFPFVTGSLRVPTMDQLPFAAAYLTYYSITVFFATPMALLYILWTSRMREKIWDRIFFSSSLCLHLYALSLIGFFLLATWDALLSPRPTLNIFQSLSNNPITVGTLWVILFSMPPVLLNTPIGYAANFERHGFKGVYPPLGSLSFVVTSAAAGYMLLHLTPLMANPFGLLAIGLAAILLTMTWLTLLLETIAKESSVAWLVATALVTAAVVFLAQALAA
jgi:hypothetical protein